MVSERKNTSFLKKIITIVIAALLLAMNLWFYYFIFFRVEEIARQYDFLWNIFYFSFQIIGLIIVFHLYKNPMNISFKLSWTIFILAFPFLGTFIYLMVGNGRVLPKKRKRKIDDYVLNKIPKTPFLKELKDIDPVGYKLATGVNYDTNFPIYKNTKITFFKDTVDKHGDLLKELSKATKYIFIEYFILSKGQLLDEIIEILEEKGKQGVEIKIIYDSVGSAKYFRKKTRQRISNIPNTLISAYEPLKFRINPVINYRDHRKIFIIDGKVAYCGGDNLADEYIHLKKPFGQWRDNSLKIQGQAVESFILMFTTMWYMSTKKTLEVDRYVAKFSITNESYVMPFGDGPTNKLNPTYDLFLNMISTATKTIYISTPYLIIDINFLQTLSRAAECGVDVRILTPGIADKKLVNQLTKAHYGELLSSGVRIYEFTPGFNHAKNVIIDGQYAYNGTTNIDYRSFFLHFECGVLFFNDKQTKIMHNDFLDALSKSTEILYPVWRKRSPATKFIQFVMRVFTPLF